MHSRKRHLLAFLLTLLPTAGLVLGWLNWADGMPDQEKGYHVVPIQLGEMIITTSPAAAPASVQPKHTFATATQKQPRRPEKTTHLATHSPPDKQPRKAAKAIKPIKPVKPSRSAKPVTRPKPVKPRKPQQKAPSASKAGPPPVKPDSSPPSSSATSQKPARAQSATPSVSPAATQRVPTVDAGLKRRYLEQLRRTIAMLAQDSYPYRARRRGQTGIVTLRFIIHPDGHLSGLTLLNSSGYPLLDEAAQGVIEDEMGMRFKPFPPGLGLQHLEVTIPIRYQLR